MRMRIALLVVPFVGLAMSAVSAAERAVVIPPPTVASPAKTGTQTIILAGGCFWGVQAVYQHTKGVISAVSGYAGGEKQTAHYESVGTGRTGHAELVSVTFDPQQVSYGKILQIYFSVAHNPTELNYQGPDVGTQYRSAIFYADDEQKKFAGAYIAELDKAHVFPRPIVTPARAAARLLSGRRLSSGLCGAAPVLSVHRVQRPAEGRQPEQSCSRPTIARCRSP